VRVYRRVKHAPAGTAELVSADYYASQAAVIRVGKAPATPSPEAGGEGPALGGAPAGGAETPAGEPKKPAR
jgi:hypothetical protein